MQDLNLKIDRIYKGDKYTIGKLYIDNEFFCDTLEDVDRNLNFHMSPEDIKKKKIYGETAIPTGKYRITMNEISPKFKSKPTYSFTGGFMPRILNVPGFSGILLHAGNDIHDSSGCPLVGKNTIKGGLTDSLNTFKKLYSILEEADNQNRTIYIEIN